MLWRHGDVFLARVETIPTGLRKLPHCRLAEGEITGHAHRISEPHTADLFEGNGERFLHIRAPQATLMHEEHAPITLEQGIYRVWIQREYSPEEIRRVID